MITNSGWELRDSKSNSRNQPKPPEHNQFPISAQVGHGTRQTEFIWVCLLWPCGHYPTPVWTTICIKTMWNGLNSVWQTKAETQRHRPRCTKWYNTWKQVQEHMRKAEIDENLTLPSLVRRFFRSLARETAALMPILSIQPSGHISASCRASQPEMKFLWRLC